MCGGYEDTCFQNIERQGNRDRQSFVGMKPTFLYVAFVCTGVKQIHFLFVSQ